MVGIGRTVFDGTQVEEFKANILGVLENVIGPQRNLILAKLEGGPLANTGVIAGMSGSPVYIDGKLIGAVSYSLGSFSKEPIAGITPIAEMTDATALDDAAAAGRRVHVEFPLTRESLTAAFRKALNWNRPFADRPDDARVARRRRVAGLGGGQLGTLLRPIATPLVMSGFEPDVADMLGGAFRDQGFIPTGGSAAGVARRRDAVRRPAQAGRRGRRDARQRRSAAGRHRHGHAHRRRPRLRVRPSDVQPRADRVPDDARLRLHRAAEPVLVDEAVDAPARSSARCCRIARRRSPAGSAPGPRMIPITLTLESDRGAEAARSTSTSSTISCSRR